MIFEDVEEAPAAAAQFELRTYQAQWNQAIAADRAAGFTRLLVEAATGTGKTTVFAALAAKEVAAGGRVLVLENRDRLVDQTADRIRIETGLDVEIERASDIASPTAKVVVASVQTLGRVGRLTGFPDDHFTLVIADEAHHSLSNQWFRILGYFHYGADSLDEEWMRPNDGGYRAKAAIVGFTATPDIGEKKNLGQIFQKFTVNYPYLDAVNEGWLVPPVTESIPIKVDLRKFRTGRTPNGSDFKPQDISAALVPIIEELAEQVVQRAADRKTISFVPSIECAKMLAAAISRRGLKSIFVSGECLDVDEKTEDFVRSGRGTVLVNAALYCLDMKTEVLTNTGFVLADDITDAHEVANWNDDGTVFFERPKRIIRRQLHPDEHMVSVETARINFRVTNTHDMVVRCGEGGWSVKKIKAEVVRDGHVFPGCGVALPAAGSVPQEIKTRRERLITANSYTLRSRYGYGYEASVIEATRRQDVRGALRRRRPSELTEDECRLIGFWIADGTVGKLQTGGLEYKLSQSTVYPHIIKWIDGVLTRLGLHFLKKLVSNNGFWAFSWSLSRGTGGGSQERVGVYGIEPYLIKDGTPLFWCLNEKQFDALVEGYWYGDGQHGSGEHGHQGSVLLRDTKKPWIELLCAIGTVRGWRCSLGKPTKPVKDHHKIQWPLTMIKGQDLHVSCKTKINHEPYNPEEVWCVTTRSGKIITRRNGKVMVTGNCEGADFPDIDCVAWFRPTISRAFYCQGVGRGTRVLPGVLNGCRTAGDRRSAIARSAKPNVLILDPLFVSDRIDLCDAYDLFTDKPEVKAKMKATGDLSAEGAETAERDFIKSLEKAAKKAERKKARVINPLAWAVSMGDAKLASYRPETDSERKPASEPQLNLLRQHHIDVSKITCAGLAHKMIGIILTRHTMKLATPSQLDFLHKLGANEEEVAVLKVDEATALIDRLKRERGWN